MEKRLILIKELSPLDPLIGKWIFKGSFRDNPDKMVEGWESYEITNDGRTIICMGETITLWPKGKDVYKNKMGIVYDKEKKKIVGEDDWVFNIDKGMFSVQNNRHLFTGRINESNDIITGKWENKDEFGNCKYWYDKVLTKIN